MSQNKPFVTFLMCCRIKDNPDSMLDRMLHSIPQFINDQETNNIEVLIKFDSNDEQAYKNILNRNWETDSKGLPGESAQPNLLSVYPFSIRHFVYAQGEGRYSLHNDYMFLFSQRNPSSQYVSFITDDCYFKEQGFMATLRGIKNKDYSILGDIKPVAERYKDWRKNQKWKHEVTPFPIISCKLLEILQNMGWQVNIDNWLTLIHVILVNKYGIDLWERIPKFFERSKQSAEYRKETYNPLDITNLKDCTNPYYFNLVEQAAKNIYLNFIEKNLKEFAATINKIL